MDLISSKQSLDFICQWQISSRSDFIFYSPFGVVIESLPSTLSALSVPSAFRLSASTVVVSVSPGIVSVASAVAVFFFEPDNNATLVKDFDKNKSVPMTTAIAVSGNTYAELYAKLYTYIELKPSGANEPNANAPAKKCDTKRTTPAKIPPKRNFTLWFLILVFAKQPVRPNAEKASG